MPRSSPSRCSPVCTSSCTCRRKTPIPEIDEEALERELSDAVRSWDDHLSQALMISVGEERAGDLLATFEGSFPEAYKEDATAREAVADILNLETLGDSGISVSLAQPAVSASLRDRRFTIYRAGPAVSLASVIPILNGFGVEVLDERPYLLVGPRRRRAAHLRLRSASARGGHAGGGHLHLPVQRGLPGLLVAALRRRPAEHAGHHRWPGLAGGGRRPGLGRLRPPDRLAVLRAVHDRGADLAHRHREAARRSLRGPAPPDGPRRPQGQGDPPGDPHGAGLRGFVG